MPIDTELKVKHDPNSMWKAEKALASAILSSPVLAERWRKSKHTRVRPRQAEPMMQQVHEPIVEDLKCSKMTVVIGYGVVSHPREMSRSRKIGSILVLEGLEK